MDNVHVSYLELVSNQLKKEKYFNLSAIHQAKLLLKHYRHVVWCVEQNLQELDIIAGDFGSRRIQDLVNYLSFDFDDFDKDKISVYLSSIARSREFVVLVDKAVCRLKQYPVYGELYFKIINNKYITKTEYTDQELIELLNIERTTFYKRQKEAIYLISRILWGYDNHDRSSEKYLLCADLDDYKMLRKSSN